MLEISAIPAFDDNYIWLLRENSAAAVVDPGDAEPVLSELERAGLELSAILITHHHWDHTGGIEDLIAAFPAARVFAPRDRRIPCVTDRVAEGTEVQVPRLGTRYQVMEVPGHTASHIAYLGNGRLFCGDTLFAAGCGRVFDGTFEQLAASLQRIAALPPETLLYCAHEYTLANLGFAAWVEPDSPAVVARTADARQRREKGQPTVPSRVADELATNPFVRTQVADVKAAAERYAGRPLATSADVFTALRRWKDKKYD
ncbi:MAG: hydroxyacylglutathione hydrolase [Chromatiaceae bacterium]|jgi:hydroxyacylglutathione hydrolase